MNVWQIPANPLGWLWPALALLGIFIQLSAIWKERRLWLIAGLLPVMFAASIESDITLFVGDMLAVAGLWFMQGKKPDKKD